jgi:hypothetical protein
MDAARWASVVSTLQMLRDQLAQYKLEHNDADPDFQTYPRWEQLLRPTYADGTFADLSQNRAAGPRTGPYMRSVPPNAVNGASEVSAVEGPVKAGSPVPLPPGIAKVGYVFFTSTGELRAADATGKRVADAEMMVMRHKLTTAAGKAEVFQSLVQTLRSQLALYRLQHQDQLPDFRRYPLWEQLLNKTDATGAVLARGPLGPYLPTMPVNPMNGWTAVALFDGEPAAGLQPEGLRIGWVIDSNTGKVWGTDHRGQVISP